MKTQEYIEEWKTLTNSSTLKEALGKIDRIMEIAKLINENTPAEIESLNDRLDNSSSNDTE